MSAMPTAQKLLEIAIKNDSAGIANALLAHRICTVDDPLPVPTFLPYDIPYLPEYPLVAAAKNCNKAMIEVLLRHARRYNEAVASCAVFDLIRYGYYAYGKLAIDQRQQFLADLLDAIELLVKYGGKAEISNSIAVLTLSENNQSSCDYRLAVIEKLISLKCKVNERPIKGHSPLREAVYSNDLALVRLLFDNGAEVTQDEELLHLAVENKNLAMIECLVKNGVNVNQAREQHYSRMGMFQETPLDLAAVRGNDEIADFLIAKCGANPTEVTVKCAVCLGSNIALIQLLQKKISIKDVAFCWGSIGRTQHDIIRLLVENEICLYSLCPYLSDRYIEWFCNPIKSYNAVSFEPRGDSKKCSLISLKLFMAHGQKLYVRKLIQGLTQFQECTDEKSYLEYLNNHATIQHYPVLHNFLATIFNFDRQCESGSIQTAKDVSDFVQQHQANFDENDLDQSIVDQLGAKDKLLLKGHGSFFAMLALRANAKELHQFEECLRNVLKNKTINYVDAYGFQSSSRINKTIREIEKAEKLLTATTKKNFADVVFNF